MRLRCWNKRRAGRKPKRQKSYFREWADALVFAVVLAGFIRWGTFEAFAIPTPSMEGSLLVGDYLFVSKLHYGSRTPVTPLQVPLTHQTIWGTDLAAYSDKISLKPFRLPGFSAIKRNDPVVFNFPAEEGHPVDLKTHYIKRAVALAGDTVTIRNAQVYINGKAAAHPEAEQHAYKVATERAVPNNFFASRGITDVYPTLSGYVIYMNAGQAEELAGLEYIREVRPLTELPGQAGPGIFPQQPERFSWNKDHFGPLYVPAAGATVAITPQTLPLYQQAILEYEHLADARVEEGKLFIDGEEVKAYTFRQNYYFMLGDNRDNSLDSRYWGFVPEDHVVGKAVLVWASFEPGKDFWESIRWNRLLSPID